MLTFEIQPPLYLRPMFFVPLVLLVGIVALLVVSASVRKRQYNQTLRERDARFRAVVEHQTEFILRVIPDGTITFVNEAFCALFGKSREELTGRRILSLLGANGDSEDLHALLHPAADGSPSVVEHQFLDLNMDKRWLHWSSIIIPDDGGGRAEIQIIGRDITESKAVQENLVRSEERYRIVAEQTGQVVYEHDIATGKITWLGALDLVTGYSAQEFQDVDLDALNQMIHTDDRMRVGEGLTQSRLRAGYYQLIYRLRQKSGMFVDILDNGVTLAGAHGGCVRRLGTMTDVTERRQAEAIIASSLKEKEVLLKEIHHRVKNNLQVISSLLSLQAASVKDDETLELLRESQNRIRSMALIHERLYQSHDLARIDFDEYARSLVAFLARSYSVPRVRVQLAVQNIELSVNAAIPCGLIINELVSNALKYAFPDGMDGEVVISVSFLPDGKCMLVVKDNGIGLPDDLEIGKTSTLGLQLVNTLTNQLGGTITVTRDRGTAFSITFPPEA